LSIGRLGSKTIVGPPFDVFDGVGASEHPVPRKLRGGENQGRKAKGEVTMDKRQLVNTAARRSGLSRRQVAEALEAILETIAEALAAGDGVTLKSFGRFWTWERRQQVRGFDGQTHRIWERQLIFKASAALRRRLKENQS
jgi:nucleoid DNA-binding protein